MKRLFFMTLVLTLFLSSCTTNRRSTQQSSIASQTPIPEQNLAKNLAKNLATTTVQAMATMTSLPFPCATPEPAELSQFIQQSITSADNGKTFVTHVTSRFWIYLDDRIYHVADLLNAIPDGLIGYVSNGSIRGPQCYPVMFEAVKEGKGLLQVNDFQLQIIVDNNAPESELPLLPLPK